MRQVFLGSPWIHAPADPDIVRLFNTCGRWAKLPAGGCIFNGGDRGEIALLLSGLGAFSFQDRHGRNHIFTLILPGRLMGDVDGYPAVRSMSRTPRYGKPKFACSRATSSCSSFPKILPSKESMPSASSLITSPTWKA